MQVPLSRPDITESEIEEVLTVLKSPHLSLGPKQVQFESSFARWVGRRHAVAVSSGTAGLHLTTALSGIGESDAVITSPFSFVASANAILYERAIPIFVDIEPKALNLDPNKMRELIDSRCHFDGEKLVHRSTKRRIRAVLPVHIFGHPAEMDEIVQISAHYGLEVIEDACEAIGAKYKGKKVGTFGEMAVFAFYPNKQITTGEGGMVVTDDEEIASLLRSLRNQGRRDNPIWLEHVRLGYNYRMDELSAALGVAQLRRIDDILEQRSRKAQIYNEALKGVDEVETPWVDPRVEVSWYAYVARLRDESKREPLLNFLHASGVGTRPYFPPIHLHPYYRESLGFKEGDFPIAEAVSRRTVALPFHNGISEEEIHYVVGRLKEGLARKGS